MLVSCEYNLISSFYNSISEEQRKLIKSPLTLTNTGPRNLIKDAASANDINDISRISTIIVNNCSSTQKQKQ